MGLMRVGNSNSLLLKGEIYMDAESFYMTCNKSGQNGGSCAYLKVISMGPGCLSDDLDTF